MEKKNWIKEIAERAYQYHDGRKIVSWGYYEPSFDIDKTLLELYGLKIDFYVDSDLSLVDEVHVFSPEILNGSSDLYYVIVPLAFYSSIKDYLVREGYKDNDYYYFNDCIIENTKKLYLDRHGNKVINPPRNVKCTFWGYNNVIEFPESPGFYTKVAIIAGSENKIKIESREIRNTNIFMWEDNSFILKKGSVLYDNRILFMIGNVFEMDIQSCMLNSDVQLQYKSKMHMANNSAYEGNVKLVQGSVINIGENSEIACHFTGHPKSQFLIGKDVTIGGFHNKYPSFCQENIFFAIDEAEIIISDDCLFSINIKLICGDGHTIFDTKTGENLNSASKMHHSIIVHKYVWVGANAILLSGTEIGRGGIVGAGSIVNKIFPENCAIAGNPAKVIHENRTWNRLWGVDKMQKEKR